MGKLFGELINSLSVERLEEEILYIYIGARFIRCLEISFSFQPRSIIHLYEKIRSNVK